jgi:hypothetical protein
MLGGSLQPGSSVKAARKRAVRVAFDLHAINSTT